MPASARTASNESVNWPAIADQEPKTRGALAEVHHEITRLLRRPGSVRMPGHAKDVPVAVADFDCEQDVEPAQRDRAVDVEEVDGQHAGGLASQELPPTGVGVPLRRVGSDGV
jgi:hypothetical protein